MRENDPRDVVYLTSDEHEAVEAATKALSNNPNLYKRGGYLVMATRAEILSDAVTRAAGSLIVRQASLATLRIELSRSIRFMKYSPKGDRVKSHPQMWLVAGVRDQGEWTGVRELRGVSDSPLLRPDGSIWQTKGYDDRTGFLYEPTGPFPQLPKTISLEEAQEALKSLQEVVRDFRFAAPEHEAAWLAALLTVLARTAFVGPSPLFLLDANVRGSGKTLAALCIALIALGYEMPVSGYVHDAVEMAKKISSCALAGDRVVLFDNLDGPFGDAATDRALTSTSWKDRALGTNENLSLPLFTVWLATGNNVAVAADTARRIIHIRLEVMEEKPEERTGFLHPDLLAWVKENRPRLLVAALAILQGYFQAGCPQQTLTPFGSFEGWSKIVRQAVVWVGLPDPCLTRTNFSAAADQSREVLVDLMAAWRRYDPQNHGLVVAELLPSLYAKDLNSQSEVSVTLRAAVEAFVGLQVGRTPTARQLGNKLKSHRRRTIGGIFFDTGQKCKSGVPWRLFNSTTNQSHINNNSCETLVTLINTPQDLFKNDHKHEELLIGGGPVNESPESQGYQGEPEEVPNG